jgi:diaminopimelate decarboxylase
MNTQALAAFAVTKETPFYLYELGTIGRQFQILKEALPEICSIYYSMKANPHKEVVMELVRLGANVDISSHLEMLRTISWGVHPSKLSLVGPGKTEALLVGAVQARIGVIVVESLSEILRLDRIAQAQGRRMSVKLRINPKLWIDQAGRARKSQSSQFGIDETQLSATIDRLLSLNCLDWVGIHCHVQSSFLSAEYLLNNFRNVISIGKELAHQYPGKIQGITIGGGLGIAMFSDQEIGRAQV